MPPLPKAHHCYVAQLILDSHTYVEGLPWTIEAAFYQEADCTGVWDGPKCEEYAREAYDRFLEKFKVTSSDIPLLRLDPKDWAKPFRLDPKPLIHR